MYKQGDILLIPVPFSDLTSHKKRPVLVLSNNAYQEKTDDILVAAITSNVLDKEYEINITNNEMQTGSLKTISCVRADKLYRLPVSLITSC